MDAIERAAKEACYALAIEVFSLLLIGHLLYRASRRSRTSARIAPKHAGEMSPLYRETWVPSLTAWAQSPRKARERSAAD